MNVEIKETKNKGKGIFALKDFKKDELILNITGEITETDKPETFPEKTREHWAPVRKEGNIYKFISPESPWMYMNHSCNCNSGVINDRKLIAVKKVKKGEEITVDYSTFNLEMLTGGEKQLEMECKCKDKNCRKTIFTFDKLPKKDQERIKRFLNNYSRKQYIRN